MPQSVAMMTQSAVKPRAAAGAPDRPAPAASDEMSDDDLECVVGGLSRPWEGDEPLHLRERKTGGG